MDKQDKEKIEQEIRKYLAEIGRKGGIKASKSMSSKERTERARKAVKARWSRARKDGGQ